MKRWSPKSVARITRAAVLATIVQSGIAYTAEADNLYWDLNGVDPNTGTTASGTWDGVNAFWNTAATGTGGEPRAVTTIDDNLFFSSGTGYTGASAVSLTIDAAANGITFEEGTINLSGNQLTLGAGGLKFINGTGGNTIANALVLTTGSQITSTDNTLQTLSGNISGTGNLAINANGSGGITLSGSSLNITGTLSNTGTGSGLVTISSALGGSLSGLVQNSATSRLSLTADNSAMTGNVTVSAGTLHGANLGTSNTLQAFGSGVLRLEGGTALMRANASGNNVVVSLTNSGLDVAGSATIDVNRVNTNGNRSGVIFAVQGMTIGASQLSITGGNSYSFRVAGPTLLTDNATFNPTTANLSLTGVIDDGDATFGFIKTGAGTLSLTAANTFGGQVAVLGGSLTMTNIGALGVGSSAVLLGNTTGSDDARLNLGFNALLTRDVVVQSGGTGVVRIHANPASFENGRLGGTLTLGSADGAGRGVVFSSETFRTLTIESVIQDPAGLVGDPAKVTVDSGTVVLSGDNTFSGGVVINGGFLRAQNDNALGTGTVIINAGGLGGYQYASGGNPIVTLANPMVWNGDFVSGTGAGPGLVLTGAVTLTGNRTLSLDTTTTVFQGVIDEDDENASYSLTFRNSGTFSSGWTLSAANQFGGGVLLLASTGSTTINANNESALGSGQVRLTSRSTARLNLVADLTIDSLSTALAGATPAGGSGAPDGTQDLVFTGGGGTGAAGTATVSGGVVTSVTITDFGRNYTSAPTITLSNPGEGDAAIAAVFQAASVTLNNRTLTIAGTNAAPAGFFGVISGSGNVVKQGAGEQIFSGVNTYTGATSITGGTLRIVDAGSINATSGIAIDGGTLRYESSETLTQPVTFGAAGGTFAVGAGSVYSGGDLTLGADAVLAGNGTVGAVDASGGGTIAPGDSVGTLTLTGNLNLAGGTYAAEIGSTSDLIALTDTGATVNLTGANLDLSFLGGGTDGELYFLISNANPEGGTTGQFATLNGLAVSGLDGVGTFFFGGFEFAISYTADFDTQSFSGGNDVAIQAVSVPEPASLSLLALSAGGLLARRRRCCIG